MNPNIDSMLHFTIQKTPEQVKTAVTKKIKALESKIAEREGRVAKLREEYKIDDKALIALLTEARRDAAARIQKVSYSFSNSSMAIQGPEDQEVVIGAGLVNNLLTEYDQIENEKYSIKRLGLIERNLDAVQKWSEDGDDYYVNKIDLSYEELEYLGF